MKQFTYLALLIFSISGLLVADWRYRLAFWQQRTATIKTLAAGVILFIVWDLLGIGLGIFRHGNSEYSLPLRLVPEFPLEEVFFLFLLCYITLLAYQGGARLWRRT